MRAEHTGSEKMDGMISEDLILDVENRLQVLTLVEKDTPRILSRGKLREIQKHFIPLRKRSRKSKTSS